MVVSALWASSVLVVFLVLALAREIRLRRALQELLRRLLEKWRSFHDA
jgi:beta-lactamase regulating signal transducer with metallopeptidase domain